MKIWKFEKFASILSARFQLENWNAPARHLHSSAWLEPENSSSDSSLVTTTISIEIHRDKMKKQDHSGLT